MRLKRIFTPEGKLDYLSIGDTGVKPEQNFSDRFVQNGLVLGYIEIRDNDELFLDAYPEILRYQIIKGPGFHCLQCDEVFSVDDRGLAMREHIKNVHDDIVPNNPRWPNGYMALREFRCVLDASQHEKYKDKQDGKPPVFPMKGVK